MKTEIAVVIFFLKGCLKRDSQNTEKIDRFVERLAVALQEKFHGHWYPDDPSKGQAYRCIRINEFYQHDPELLRACQESGIGYQELKLPHELTLWVDPGEVCCRYDENRSWFSLATMCEDKDEKEIAQMVTKALDGKASDHQYQPRQSNPTIPKQQSCTQRDHDEEESEAKTPDEQGWRMEGGVDVVLDGGGDDESRHVRES
ncbi:protein BTG3-like [Eucyclogobius newberryi]|uniref:protein BTG3-like n=1 Tax=Eucyclogobius newberryi TaxID=166745 RepID=UPI003B5B7C37